ncbi:MAG: phosphopyruvate hydratase [Caldilineaceae bacterium]|nr:phosphopyruvate hydratase [Caldilineaceae bacterium]
MPAGSTIVAVTARQIFSDRGHPGVEATVTTQNGAKGTAVVTAGISVGEHEVEFAYDGGKKWNGRGVQKAVDNAINIIGPKVIGLDATRQMEVDEAIIKLDGTPTKSKLGGNATGSVSAAVLQAGAASLGIPLYQHIGGVNATTLPVPGVISITGSGRYGSGKRSGGKPSHSFMCYDFDTFSDASYAAWTVSNEFTRLLKVKFDLETRNNWGVVSAGLVKHDRELWDLKTEAIKNLGYEDKVGIQIDVAAGTYYEKKKKRYVGLFSAEEKSTDDMMRLYEEMVANYPIVILEDPLDENDYEGHAELTKRLGIEIVGDDLFTTNPDRLQQGLETGAANTMLLKVYQIGTITEAFEAVQMAYSAGYGVMPCDSRGEGYHIADYCVGLNTLHLREGGTGPVANRFLAIEAELGPRAKFAGRSGIKGLDKPQVVKK